MTTYFETKEHYQAFRNAWARAVNDDRAKKQIIEVPHTDWRTGSKTIIKEKSNGWIGARHHILFNILRGKQPDTGFTPTTNSNKLRNGAYFNYGYWAANYSLRNIIECAKKIKSAPEDYFYQRRVDSVTAFLKPFDGTVTIEMLQNVEVPEERLKAKYDA